MSELRPADVVQPDASRPTSGETSTHLPDLPTVSSEYDGQNRAVSRGEDGDRGLVDSPRLKDVMAILATGSSSRIMSQFGTPSNQRWTESSAVNGSGHMGSSPSVDMLRRVTAHEHLFSPPQPTSSHSLFSPPITKKPLLLSSAPPIQSPSLMLLRSRQNAFSEETSNGDGISTHDTNAGHNQVPVSVVAQAEVDRARHMSQQQRIMSGTPFGGMSMPVPLKLVSADPNEPAASKSGSEAEGGKNQPSTPTVLHTTLPIVRPPSLLVHHTATGGGGEEGQTSTKSNTNPTTNPNTKPNMNSIMNSNMNMSSSVNSNGGPLWLGCQVCAKGEYPKPATMAITNPVSEETRYLCDVCGKLVLEQLSTNPNVKANVQYLAPPQARQTSSVALSIAQPPYLAVGQQLGTGTCGTFVAPRPHPAGPPEERSLATLKWPDVDPDLLPCEYFMSTPIPSRATLTIRFRLQFNQHSRGIESPLRPVVMYVALGPKACEKQPELATWVLELNVYSSTKPFTIVTGPKRSEKPMKVIPVIYLKPHAIAPMAPPTTHPLQAPASSSLAMPVFGGPPAPIEFKTVQIESKATSIGFPGPPPSLMEAKSAGPMGPPVPHCGPSQETLDRLLAKVRAERRAEREAEEHGKTASTTKKKRAPAKRKRARSERDDDETETESDNDADSTTKSLTVQNGQKTTSATTRRPRKRTRGTDSAEGDVPLLDSNYDVSVAPPGKLVPYEPYAKCVARAEFDARVMTESVVVRPAETNNLRIPMAYVAKTNGQKRREDTSYIKLVQGYEYDLNITVQAGSMIAYFMNHPDPAQRWRVHLMYLARSTKNKADITKGGLKITHSINHQERHFDAWWRTNPDVHQVEPIVRPPPPPTPPQQTPQTK